MAPIFFGSSSQIFSGAQVGMYAIISLLNATLLLFASMKLLLALQQGNYMGKRYFKWLSSPETPYLSRLMLLCFLGFLFFCVLNVCFAPIFEGIFGKETGLSIASLFGFCSYLLFTILYINTESAVNAKVPLKKTKRMIRLEITYFIVLFFITFFMLALLDLIAYSIGDEIVCILRFSIICGMPILTPYILFIAYCINEPFEYVVRTRLVKIATLKLDKSDVIKIGVTGSFGKTSVKEILKTILSQKYRVLATPESYNTPLGISLAVKKLDSTHDVFIAEMGARNVGDIKILAEMVKPTYGLLTGTNTQHMETFKTEENIKITKYELFDYLDSNNGVAFFNADNENAKILSEKYKGEKYLTGSDNENLHAYATNVRTDRFGTTFTLNIANESPIECQTVLLGKHSIINICLCASLAYKMGLSINEIAQGINRIQSIGHRLELMPNNKGIVIIDDSYNANETGVKAAMEVLELFEGRKIILTPGLVELGKRENVANYEYGQTLARHADVVILTGKHNAETIINGLLDGGFDRENIIFAKTLNKGNAELNKIIKEGDVVMFENDLPDNYN